MSYNTGNPIGSSDPRDMFDNAENLDNAVNSTDLSFTDRLGNERMTLAGFEAAGFTAADIYADVATGRAAVADGAQFQVVEGDEIVRYRRDSSSTQTEMARYPTAAAVAELRDELITVQLIGHPTDPVPDGTAGVSNNTFVFAAQAEKSGVVRKVRLNSAAGGTLKLSTWSKSGDLFTRTREVSITVVAGAQTLTDVGLDVSAGEYLGFYGNGTVETKVETADSGGWYVGGPAVSSFTDATITTTARLSISYDIETVDRVDALEAELALKAPQSDVDAIEADIYTTKTLNIGTKGAMTSGSGDLDGALYALEQACQQDGTVSEVRLFTIAAATVRIMVFSKSGDAFTVVGETSVSAAGGYEVFAISLPISAGQHVGVQSTNVGLQAGVSDTFGWYGGMGTTSFTDAAPTRSSRILAGFSVEYTETTFNGASRPAAVDMPWENMLLISMGQSLWEGSDGDVTTAVEYDNKGFPAYPAAPVSIDDATVANTERATSRGEWPGLGAASAIRAALLRDNNLAYTDISSTIVVANDAVGGSLITQINKGTAPFAAAVAQAAALAGVTGKSSGVLAVTFGQGESDSTAGTDPATYLASLIQLAKDADADLRAASGQSKRIPTVVYQMNATGRDIGLMHLQASLDSPLIYCAGPMYWLTYYDTLHINAASSRLVGALHGEVIKQVVIDGEDWEPLRPIAASVLGNTITMTFTKSGLVLDSTSLPGQTNSGFVVKNGAGTAQTVSAVEVINGNQVRLTCATPPESGWTVEYGVAAAGRSDAFIGLMGNLRDNAGAERTFDGEAIHNWCVVFDWSL